MDIKGALNKIASRQDLTGEEMRSVMTTIMDGEATPSQIGAFLMGMRVKGETVGEIAAAVSILRDKMVQVAVDAFGNALGESLAASWTSAPVPQGDALGDFIDENKPAWAQRQANYDSIVSAFSQSQGSNGAPGVLVADARDALQLSNPATSDDAAYYANIINALQARDAARQAASASRRAGEARAVDALYASGAGDVRDLSSVFSDGEIDAMRQANLARHQALAGGLQDALGLSGYETGIYSTDPGSIDYYRQRDGRVVVEITGTRTVEESLVGQVVGGMNERLNSLVEDAQDHYVQSGARGGEWNYALNAAGYVASEFFPRSVGRAVFEAVGGPIMGKVLGASIAQVYKLPVLGGTVSQLVRSPRSSTIGDATAGAAEITGKYGRFVDAQTFADEAFYRYQKYTDEAYASVIKAYQEGRVVVPKGMSLATIIGQRTDASARIRMTRWLDNEGIAEGLGQAVHLNRRLRDPLGSGSYRIPDLSIPGANMIMDGTVGFKWQSTPQIADFYNFSGGSNITIVRPAELGGSYSLVPPY